MFTNLKLLTAVLAGAATIGSAGLVSGMGDTGDPSDLDVSPSPTPSESPEGTPTPDPDTTPTPDPTLEPTPGSDNVPNGNAYGWWRNQGVMKEKPGNGPKPKTHNDGGEEEVHQD